eukprot:7381722-Prymnesium_polylepis.1
MAEHPPSPARDEGAQLAQAVLDAPNRFEVLSLAGVNAKKLYDDGDEDGTKRAYRKLAAKIHPDKLPEHTDLAMVAFKKLIRAVADPAELVQSVLDAANSGEAEWHYAVLSLSGRDVTKGSSDKDIEEAYDALKEQLEAAPDSEEKEAALDALKRARIEAMVAWVKRTHRTVRTAELTRDGAVKILMLRAPGRFAVDAFSKFWSCELGDNRWSTDDVRFKRLLFRMRGDLEHWAENEGALESYFERDPDYYDPTLHEKMDKTLGAGDTHLVRALAPTDYVSVAGAVDRDLPDDDELDAKWGDDAMFRALHAKLRKNFSDEASCKQTLERFAWAICHGKPNDAKWWIELSGPADGGNTMLLTAYSKCLPGLVKKINISLFSTTESKKSSGPNVEALCELQGVRVAYAEEPSKGMELDGGFLKDQCGG